MRWVRATDTMLCVLPVLRSMVTAMGFQILVGSNSPIKPITDNTLVTLEVSEEPITPNNNSNDG